MITILVSLVGFALGALSGRRLAARGVTSTNALQGRQGITYVGVLAGTVVAALLYFRPFATRMPAWVVVYAEAVFIPGTLLSVDTVAGTVTLGNPLQGRQELALAQLDGYWIGEAVLVGANRR